MRAPGRAEKVMEFVLETLGSSLGPIVTQFDAFSKVFSLLASKMEKLNKNLVPTFLARMCSFLFRHLEQLSNSDSFLLS